MLTSRLAVARSPLFFAVVLILSAFLSLACAWKLDRVPGIVYEELLEAWNDVLCLQRGFAPAAQASRAEEEHFSPAQD